MYRPDRAVDPYHLFNYMGTWHFIAYCHLRKSIRDFALGRITEAAILQETFERPSNFNMKDFFQTSFGI
jgi:predicted DNA-binding transcriptional regulator YafY